MWLDNGEDRREKRTLTLALLLSALAACSHETTYEVDNDPAVESLPVHQRGPSAEDAIEVLPEYKIAAGPEASDLAALGIEAPTIVPPVASVDAFGAVGDGIADDTVAILRAIHSLHSGGTVLFTDGKTYLKHSGLRIDIPNVTLWGNGATLYSDVSEQQEADSSKAGIAVTVAAPHVVVTGLHFTSNLSHRVVGHQNVASLVLTGDSQMAYGNHFDGSENGILVLGARNFLVAKNSISRTWADGIHITGAKGGIVANNIIRQTGDDMIGIVDYHTGAPSMSDILVQGNDLADEFWGRGLSVVGGKNITLRKNHVARTPFGAGILVNSETSYKTANVENVLVEENLVEEVQTMAPSYDPLPPREKTGQGAIDIFGQGQHLVTDVLVRSNQVRSAGGAGILVRGRSCGVMISENSIDDTRGAALATPTELPQDCVISCEKNTSRSKSLNSDVCGRNVGTPAVGVLPSVVASVVAASRQLIK